MQKKIFIIHNNDIYDGSEHDVSDFDGIAFLVHADEVTDVDYEECHGVHTVYTTRYDVTSCFILFIDPMGEVMRKSKIDGPMLISIEDFINSNNVLA